MQYTVYIIYSPSIDQFYIGQTCDLEKRVQEHNSASYINSFTSKTNDWILFFSIECSSRTIALKIEQHIKKMRKRKYLFDLKEHPNISKQLLEKYAD
jgi:putative endonuclease